MTVERMTIEDARKAAAELRTRAAADLAEAQALEAYARALEIARAASAPKTGALAMSAAKSESTLAQAARAHGMTLRQLATRIGVSSTTVILAANGTRPISGALAAKLRAAVGWPP